MKFEFKKNKNGTVDIMYKIDDITINLHGTAREVRNAYTNIRDNYIGCVPPDYSELDRYDNYGYEIPNRNVMKVQGGRYCLSESEKCLDNKVESVDETDDEHVKTYREDFEDKHPKSWCNGLCVNVLYYGSDDCRCPGISCKECWNRDMGT